MQVYVAADLGKIVSDEIYGPMFFQVRAPTLGCNPPSFSAFRDMGRERDRSAHTYG